MIDAISMKPSAAPNVGTNIYKNKGMQEGYFLLFCTPAAARKGGNPVRKGRCRWKGLAHSMPESASAL